MKHLRKPHGGKNVTEQVRAAYEKGLEEQKKATDRLSFMKAVQSGHIPTVRQLLLFGADIAVRNDTGKTSLHVATLNGDVEMIQELLGKGIDIEAKDDDNMAALHYAARTGNEATLRILVRHGAGASIIENKKGDTMLHDVSRSGNEGIVRLLVHRLVELDADVDTLDKDQTTALYRAAENGHSAVVWSIV